jgi:hypothetical protein
MGCTWSTNLVCPSPAVCSRNTTSLPLTIRSSNTATESGKESGPISVDTLNFAAAAAALALAPGPGFGFRFGAEEGASIVDPGRAGLLSGKEIEPPD